MLMNINTPSDAENWKDVEITGYAKINSIVVSGIDTSDDDLTWYARSGKQNPHILCEGQLNNVDFKVYSNNAGNLIHFKILNQGDT
jgi:hypothetical protein